MQHPLLALLHIPERGKVVSAREAVTLIRPGDTVATSGFVGTGFAEHIACAVEELFLAPDAGPDAPVLDKPRDLTLVYAAGQGDGKTRGLNHFGHEGLVKRIIGGHWGLVPKLQALAVAGYYLGVTRYTTNTFLRVQLGDALRQRDLAPQLYETATEAAARLDPSGEFDDHT
jgi:hypothetical protein